MNLTSSFSGAIVYYTLHRLFLWPYVLSPLRNVPGPPLGHVIYGQSTCLVNSKTGIPQREWMKQYGPAIRIVGPVGLEQMLFLKPEALQQILVTDWLEYPRPQFLRNILGLVAGYGLLTVTGDDHKLMRKAMNPAFSIRNLMTQMQIYYETIYGLVDILNTELYIERTPNEGKVVQIYDWMSKVTLDIVCRTAFGYHPDSLHNPHNELAIAYENLTSLQNGPNMAKLAMTVSIPGGQRLLASDWMYKQRHWFDKIEIFRSLRTLVECLHSIRQISSKMLKEKMNDAERALGDTDENRDLMSILVRARKAQMDGGKGGYSMSDRAMMDQVLTVLGAGPETIASGLTWTLWLLANNPESQQKLRNEVKYALAENPHPDYRTLKDLIWLDCVVKESLRVMPPVPFTARKAMKDGAIDGIVVPSGTIISIPIFVVNTWKEIWGEDAEEFRPSRWLNLPPKYHPTFSMLSFIAGPHSCIGKTMAIIEMKTVLAVLINNFEFEPAFDGQKAKHAAAMTMKPTDGMPLRIKRI